MNNIVINPVEVLRNHSLFNGLDPTVLESLQPHVKFEHFQNRQRVAQKDSHGDSLLLIISGRVQVTSFSEDGRETEVVYQEAGGFCGAVSVIDGQDLSLDVVAVTDTVVGFLNGCQAKEVMMQHPLVAERILQYLCRVIRQGNRVRAELGAANAHARVFSVLCNAMTPQTDSGLAVIIDNIPTQNALAKMANVSRESVSRALKQLINKGVVVKDRRRLIVYKPHVLQDLAKVA
jgi:CRP/FNR family cyclic AMP-dependent transcriptional regulator